MAALRAISCIEDRAKYRYAAYSGVRVGLSARPPADRGPALAPAGQGLGTHGDLANGRNGNRRLCRSHCPFHATCATGTSARQGRLGAPRVPAGTASASTPARSTSPFRVQRSPSARSCGRALAAVFGRQQKHEAPVVVPVQPKPDTTRSRSHFLSSAREALRILGRPRLPS